MYTVDHNRDASRESHTGQARSDRAAACVVPAATASIPTLRRFARSVARSWGLPESVDEAAALIVTELAGNAVRHSGSPDVAVLIGLDDRALTVEVKDRGEWRPASARAVVAPGPTAHSGRGLALVNAYSTGCMLWCEPHGTRAVAKVLVPRAARLGSGRPDPQPV